jgi:hypothetical protein
MSFENPYSIDQDYSATTSDFAATSGRVGVAPATVQAGRAALFKGPTGLFSLAGVDSNGNLQVNNVNPAGNALQVYTGQASPAAASQFGSLSMARMDLPAPSNYQAMTLDPTGALQVHPKSKSTFHVLQNGVACAAARSLISVVNKGTSFIRLQRLWIYQPPQSTSSNLLGLGSGASYYPLIVEIRRITGHASGGSTSTPTWASSDSADTPDANVTMYSNATISGAATAAYHRQDVLITTATGTPFFGRGDQNEKVLVLRPGEGFSVTCISSGAISAGSGTNQVTASVDIEMTLTQATG